LPAVLLHSCDEKLVMAPPVVAMKVISPAPVQSSADAGEHE
jgi:hypothetical protein